MDSGRLGDIMDAIEAALAVAMEDFDFSAAGHVLRGRYKSPPGNRLPFLAIGTPSTSSAQGPPMGSYENRPVIDIIGWASASSSTADERSRVGLALVHQLKKALDTARKTPGNALYQGGLREFVVESTVVDGDKEPVPVGMTIAVLSVQLAYTTREGL